MEDVTPKQVRVRTFSQLHRDAWRTAFQYPVYFLITPVLIYFPFDFLGNYLALMFTDSLTSELKFTHRYYQFVDAFVGTFLAGFVLELIRRIAKNEPISFGVLVKKGFVHFPKLLAIAIYVGVQVFLRLLLLIIPGVVQACKLALTPQIYIFEGIEGKDVLLKSTEYMKGHLKKIFFYSISVFVIYWVGLFGLYGLFPDNTSPLILTIMDAPFNMLVPVWWIGICLFYADVTQAEGLSRPIGVPNESDPGYDALQEQDTGRKSVGFAVFISLALFISAIAAVFLAPLSYETLYFKNDRHAIHYSEYVDQRFAEQVVQICNSNPLFQDDTADWVVSLDGYPEEKEYYLYLWVPEGQWDDSLIRSQSTRLAEEVASVLGVTVEFYFYDEEQDIESPPLE